MSRDFSEQEASRRSANARGLAAFGAVSQSNAIHRVVLEGDGPDVFTIGYERRDLDSFFSPLIDMGVELVLDVRDRPMSRNPDFRTKALASACNAWGLEYESRTMLGSTDHQRDTLRQSQDFGHFRRRYRDLMQRSRIDQIDALVSLVTNRVVAMVCYERCHDECHRSILAELLHDRIDANVIAIL